MSNWKGMREIIEKVQSGKQVTRSERKRYGQFMREFTGMLDEVISIVGVATCSYFWGEVRREEMIFGRNVDED